MLQAFQQKCEVEGKYGEAKLAQEKMEEIRVKEMQTQENNIHAFQEEELAQVENAQKEQFVEFNKVWDRYMVDYEATALESLEKLKVIYSLWPVYLINKGKTHSRSWRITWET